MGVVYWDLQKIAPINSALKLPAAIPTQLLIFGKERIDCVVPIPSRRHPNLVPCFAKELAAALGIACIEAVEKTCDATEQKDLLNGVRQEENIRDSTGVVGRDVIRDRVVLLVDDMVDSRWTLTVVAAKLLEAGAMRVYPFALVKAGGGD